MKTGIRWILVLLLCTTLPAAALAAAKTSPTGTVSRDDVVQQLTRSDKEAVVTAGAGLKLVHARNLMEAGDTDGAIGVLNDITRMNLPATRAGDKLMTEAYLLLGDLYRTQPGDAARKAISFYDQGLRYVSLGEDNTTIVRALRSAADVFQGLGDSAEAFRIQGLADDVAMGYSVDLDLGVGAPSPVLEDAGDDNCGDSVDVTLDHLETMSISPAGDHNWRDFTLTGASLVRIETLSDDTFGDDTDLNLWGGCDGGTATDFIEFDDDDGPGFLSVIERCLDVGTFFVEVGGFANISTPDDFQLSISVLDTCVVPAPDDYEPDDDLSLASSIGFRNNGVGQGNQTGRDNKQIQSHSIFPEGDIDAVTFGLSRANLVRIETFGDENPDTIIGLSNSSGGLMAVNDDKAAGELSSKLDLCLPDEDWFVVAIGFSSSATFPYEFAVDVEVPCAFESEPNASCGLANPIGLGETISGIQTPGGVGENDYFSFTLDEEAFVSIATNGYDDFVVDTYLELYAGCPGTLLAEDDDGGPGFLSLIEMTLPAGTYYVNSTVSPFSLGATYLYDLTITVSEPPLAEVEPNDTCATANFVALGDNLLAAISPVADQDNFLLSVPADGFVEIETDGPSGDTAVQIQSMDGSVVIGCDDDSGNGLFSLWSCCLPAGDYCVTLKDFGDNSIIPAYFIEFRDLGMCTPTDPPGCPVLGLSCPF